MAQVYSPKDVDISFGGAISIDGWDSVSVSRNSENTSKNISADGRLGLTYSADATGTFDIEVQQQNSVANSFFAELQKQQDKAQYPLFYNITISDKSGGVLTELSGAFLDMPADQSLASEAAGRTWMFYVENMGYTPTASGHTGGSEQSVSRAEEAVEGIKESVTNAALGFAIDTALDFLS